jgi:hypothetical protein
MKLQNRERDGGFNVRESLEGHPLSVIEEGTEFDPARGDVGGGQSVDVLAIRGLTTAVDRVNLPETGCFSFFSGVVRYG